MPPQRRTYSKSFKAQVIQECSEPGASIANWTGQTSVDIHEPLCA